MGAGPAPVAPDRIDVHFAPEPVAGLAEVAVEDELVLLGGPAGAKALNRTAALVWRCLDGEVTIDMLVEELSDALGAEAHTVRDDVVALVRDLADAGLLSGVAPTQERPAPRDPLGGDAPRALEVGDELRAEGLSRLDGHAALPDIPGERVLLVNWNPTCGFCSTIEAELTSLEDALGAAEVRLVLLTTSDLDADRRLLPSSGTRSVAVTRGTGDDPFGGFGTPAAYLLSAQGRVEEPMALGSDQVLALARRVAGLDGAPHTPTDVRYLPAPAAVCGQGGGTGTVGAPWVGTRAYRFDGVHVGIRHNGDATASLLDSIFPTARVVDDGVPDNYGIALFARPGGHRRRLNLLVRGGTTLVRSRSPARVLASLLGRLSSEIAPADPDLLHVHALAAVRGVDAYLLPPVDAQRRTELQPRLARVGMALVDLDVQTVDANTAQLVIPEPAIPYDADVVARLDEGGELGTTELPFVRPGRFRLVDWAFAATDEHAHHLSPAEAVMAVLGSLTERTEEPAVVHAVASMLSHVRVHGVDATSAASLVAALGTSGAEGSG